MAETEHLTGALVLCLHPTLPPLRYAIDRYAGGLVIGTWKTHRRGCRGCVKVPICQVSSEIFQHPSEPRLKKNSRLSCPLNAAQQCPLGLLGSLLFIGCITITSGCGRAHSDLYQQRLANEARVLEDQLYEADYQNRVLHEKLQRYEADLQSSKIPTPNLDRVGSPATIGHPSDCPQTIDASSPISPTPDPLFRDAGPRHSMEQGFDADALELPDVDNGVPVGELPQSPDAFSIDLSAEPLSDPSSTQPDGAARRSANDQTPEPSQPRLPAPGGPVPPGPRDTEIPKIEPGELLPPPARGDDAKPPGQVILPDSIQASSSIPQSLRLHPTLSVGHHENGENTGADLVIGVLDALERSIDMSLFDVDAKMTIVALDPHRDPAEAKLGQWEFSSEQVSELVAASQNEQSAGKGLRVPIRWQEAYPGGDEVIVHVRLRGEDDEMRCHAKISLHPKTAAITDWTPRAK